MLLVILTMLLEQVTSVTLLLNTALLQMVIYALL